MQTILFLSKLPREEWDLSRKVQSIGKSQLQGPGSFSQFERVALVLARSDSHVDAVLATLATLLAAAANFLRDGWRAGWRRHRDHAGRRAAQWTWGTANPPHETVKGLPGTRAAGHRSTLKRRLPGRAPCQNVFAAPCVCHMLVARPPL